MTKTTPPTVEECIALLASGSQFEGQVALFTLAHLRRIPELEAENARLREALTTGCGPDDPNGCPAGHGDQCCGFHDACRAALSRIGEKP